MILTALLTGTLIGFAYAILFIAQHKKLFSTQNTKRYSIIVMSLARFMLLGLCFYFVLHSPTTNRILVLISFVCTFWFTLFWAKINPHARS